MSLFSVSVADIAKAIKEFIRGWREAAPAPMGPADPPTPTTSETSSDGAAADSHDAQPGSLPGIPPTPTPSEPSPEESQEVVTNNNPPIVQHEDGSLWCNGVCVDDYATAEYPPKRWEKNPPRKANPDEFKGIVTKWEPDSVTRYAIRGFIAQVYDVETRGHEAGSVAVSNAVEGIVRWWTN